MLVEKRCIEHLMNLICISHLFALEFIPGSKSNYSAMHTLFGTCFQKRNVGSCSST
jgi:hypothetical protein